MLTKKYPSTTRIVGIVLRSYIPNSGGHRESHFIWISISLLSRYFFFEIRLTFSFFSGYNVPGPSSPNIRKCEVRTWTPVVVINPTGLESQKYILPQGTLGVLCSDGFFVLNFIHIFVIHCPF